MSLALLSLVTSVVYAANAATNAAGARLKSPFKIVSLITTSHDREC